MAYVSDARHVAAHADQTGILRRLAQAPRSMLAWLSAWNAAAGEAAAARRVISPCGGKLTDGMEREMMDRVLHRDWA